MKKLFSVIAALFLSLSVFAETDIATAISNTAKQFSESIGKGTVVAILRISAPSEDLGKYLLDEFTLDTVKLRKQTVVARQNLDMIAKELNFQLSGEVSDETMQQIGAKTGAQTIIFGEFKPLGTSYLLTMQAFDVTTAAIIDMSREVVENDSTISMLSGKKVVSSSSSSGKSKNTSKYVFDDYTTEERLQIGFINTVGGLGSYIHGHWIDGILMTALDAAGVILLLSMEDEIPDRDSYGYIYGYHSEIDPAFLWSGIGCISGAILYGFIRPFFYHKPGSVIANSSATDGLNFGFVPAGNSRIAASLSYKMSF